MADLRIKDILKEKNKTVQELADELDISRQALSKQINGKLLVETAEKIATALEVPLWQLFVAPDALKPDNTVNSTSIIIECPHCGKPINIELKR